MRVAELMELLEGMPEDAEVRLAQQPRWVFEYSIRDALLVGPDARPVTIFIPRQSRIWPARPGMILAPSRSHDPGGVVTGPGGWLVIANRGSARIS